jgi:hypothetical protein
VVGTDNNQFAVELGRAKVKVLGQATASLGESLIAGYIAFRREHLKRWIQQPGEDICQQARFGSDAIRWFVPQVLAELAVLKSWISDPESGPGEWASTAQIVTSSLLQGKLSKARSYHYTYVVDRSRVKEEALEPVDVADLFVERVRTQFTDAEFTRNRLARTGVNLSEEGSATFARCPAHRLDTVAQTVDMVVTSPPYFAMNDYVRSQYLTWLIFPWADYESQIQTESGSRRNRRSRRALGDYLHDMSLTFQTLKGTMTPGAYLAVVMGNSTSSLAREADPTQLVRHLIEEADFEAIWSGERRIRFRKINTTPFRSESLWVFRR